MRVPGCLLLATLLIGVRSEESAESGVCEAPGLWGALLEDWATGEEPPGRQGRVMSLPPTKGYYVTDRIDGPLVPPPLPPHRAPTPHGGHAGPHGQAHQPGPYSQYDEWRASPPPPPGVSKIVNRPPNPYKDKFKPSYAPAHSPHIPVSPPRETAVDRVDAPTTPTKQVSETDLYLLTAIEKLVYRVDLMEKRLRRAEETMHYLVAGKETKPDPCPEEWRSIGSACYHVSPDAADWKAASIRCRKLRGHLLELDTDTERRTVFSALLADRELKGKDFWTGGLNPGLLWIWAHSARPLAGNGTSSSSNSTGGGSSTVLGDGRCLALAHDPAIATYLYRGHDCALRHRFICEATEDKMRLSNEIERVARQLKDVGSVARKAKLLWDVDRL